jgi:hypothetical protein
MSLESCVDHSDDDGDYVVVFDNYSRSKGRRTCPVCDLLSQKEELQDRLNEAEVALGTVNDNNEELEAELEKMQKVS